MLGAMAAVQPTFKESVESCLTQIVGVLFGALASIVLLVAVYIPRYLSDNSKILLAAILISLTTIIALFTLQADKALNPIFLAAYMITILVSGRVAAISCVFMSVVFGMIAMGSGYDYGLMVRVILTTMVGGVALLCVLNSVRLLYRKNVKES